MKFCTKCGTQNEDNALVCCKCNSSFAPPKKDIKKIIGILINSIGILNGLASFVLGIVTYSLSSLDSNFKYELLEEMGLRGNVILNLFMAPSFALGSILVIGGIFIILYFTNRLMEKNR